MLPNCKEASLINKHDLSSKNAKYLTVLQKDHQPLSHEHLSSVYSKEASKIAMLYFFQQY